MDYFSKISLRARLILFNLSVVTIFGGALLFQFNSAVEAQKEEITKNFSTSSYEASKSIAENFYSIYHNVQLLAKNESIQQKDKAKIQFYLNEVMSLYPYYDLIVVVDDNGKLISSNSLDSAGNSISVSPLKDYNFKEELWFKNVSDNRLTENIKNELYGTYYEGFRLHRLRESVLEDNKPNFLFSAPIQNEFGDLLGIIITYTDASWVDRGVLSLSNSMSSKGYLNPYISVSEGNNLIISTKKISKDGNDKLSSNHRINDKRFLNNLNWNINLQIDSDNAFSTVNKSQNTFILSFTVGVILSSILVFFITHFLSKKLSLSSGEVSTESGEIQKISEGMKKKSTTLSESTQEQANNLHQTAATLTEIKEMLSKSSARSEESRQLSLKNKQSAEYGVKQVEDMHISMDQITSAITEVINQIGINTQELQLVISAIEEIEEKTKVINDIVFQTKLLSFNASVEAARAGEAGKGFAVVAEEVGLLAENSGKAAHQISDMLTEQLSKVNKTIAKTEEAMEKTAREARERVLQGKDVSSKCSEALKNILNHTLDLNNAVDEVAAANQEQAKGVNDISQTVNKLSQTTTENTELANELNNIAVSLNVKSDDLNQISKKLSEVIYGEKSSDTEIIRLERTSEIPVKNNEAA